MQALPPFQPRIVPQPRISMPSPWVLAPVPRHWDFCQRSPRAAGPALTAPPRSWPVLQGTAPNPDSPRLQVEHPTRGTAFSLLAPKSSTLCKLSPPAPCTAGAPCPGGLGISHHGVPASGFVLPAVRAPPSAAELPPRGSCSRIPPFPCPHPAEYSRTHNSFSSALGFTLPAATPAMTASLQLGL